MGKQKRYEGFVEGTYEEYVDKMSKTGTWGDHLTLQVFANIYNVKIELYTDYEDEWIKEFSHTMMIIINWNIMKR